jgi:hypothetical protein
MLKEAVTGMPKCDKQKIRVLTASFVPGQATVFHTHRFPVTVFMLEGTFTLEMEGRPPGAIKAGQSFMPLSQTLRFWMSWRTNEQTSSLRQAFAGVQRLIDQDCEAAICQRFKLTRTALLAVLSTFVGSAAQAQMPEAIAAPGQTGVARFHAEGAQVYECKPDSAGKRVWQFREPIATLLDGGLTVGRHYAGPSWELTDGSVVVGKVAGSAPGSTAGDIPWLRLDVVAHRGAGRLDSVTTVQRIDTKGGVAPTACAAAGSFISVPYSAEYVFLRKP